MDEFEKIESNRKTGIWFLKDFLDGLILNSNEEKMSSENLFLVLKAFYILDRLENLVFDGVLRFEAGFVLEKNGSSFYVLTISEGSVILGYEGSEFNEGVGYDSVSAVYFALGEVESLGDPLENLESWKRGFMELSNEGTNFVAIDDTENMKMIDFDELDKDNNENDEENNRDQ